MGHYSKCDPSFVSKIPQGGWQFRILLTPPHCRWYTYVYSLSVGFSSAAEFPPASKACPASVSSMDHREGRRNSGPRLCSTHMHYGKSQKEASTLERPPPSVVITSFDMGGSIHHSSPLVDILDAIYKYMYRARKGSYVIGTFSRPLNNAET